jgi:hypothetical protein
LGRFLYLPFGVGNGTQKKPNHPSFAMTKKIPSWPPPRWLEVGGKSLIKLFCFLAIFSIQTQAAVVFEYYASDW